MNDFRIDSFEKVFAANLDEIEEIDKNFPELSDNQRLRAQQLLKNTHDNKERIENWVIFIFKGFNFLSYNCVVILEACRILKHLQLKSCLYLKVLSLLFI